jgi:hypothetical protein
VRRHGGANWWIEGGDGQFAQASGLVASNFTLGEDGSIVDCQSGVVLLP